MHILYGVVGVGMGHLTRSRVVIDHLVRQGHQVVVVASGGAPARLTAIYADVDAVRVHAIAGYGMRFAGQGVDLASTVLDLVGGAPARLATNARVFGRLVDQVQPDLVISDFEAFALWFGLYCDVPVVSLDNLQVLHRCALSDEVVDTRSAAFRLARAAVKAKLPGASWYLVSSFFDPPVRKARTSVVGPVLRPEVLAAQREPGAHLLVYQSVFSSELDDVLGRLGLPVVAYGADREGQRGAVTYRAFSQDGFIEDLRTARAVVAGGGYSLMCEAIHLGVPMLSVPLAGHVEQQVNAAYLQHLGYGRRADRLTAAAVRELLDGASDHHRALACAPGAGNGSLLAEVDRVVDQVGAYRADAA